MVGVTDQLQRAEAERDELQQTFDLMWAADQRAIKAWQKANPALHTITLEPHAADCQYWQRCTCHVGTAKDANAKHGGVS